MIGAAESNVYPASQVSGVAHLLVEGDHEHDEQVAEEPDEDDDREEYGHCQAENGRAPLILFRVSIRHSGDLRPGTTFQIQKLSPLGGANL